MMEEKFSGLNDEEAKKRLVEIGPNELTKKQESSDIEFFLNQFKSPLIYILVFAGLVTFFLRQWTDVIVISAAVFVNAILGFFQERKAQKALQALHSYLVPKAKVIRDSQRKIIPTRQIVPGDLVILEIGNRVPADGLLAAGTDLSFNEAILTGEAMPVKKEVKEKVFAGTEVTTGIGKMIVTQTGMKTKIGQIGKSVAELKEEKTPLQVQLDQLAKTLALVVVLIAFLIFVFGEILGYEPVEMFTISVAVAVAAIPEGLVITLTVILSLGMQRILRRQALVRKLLAAETLGSVSTICCDKTGTLTEGKMRVVDYQTAGEEKNKETEKLLFLATFLCNDLRDPLEVAMMEFAQKKLGNREEVSKTYPRLDHLPFSPEDKYIATLHSSSTASQQSVKLLFVSGAPEVVLDKCFVSAAQHQAWKNKFEEFGKSGLRLVGFAGKKLENGKIGKLEREEIKNLDWWGILLFEDPVRQGVASALRECQQAGIKVKVITGDYRPTAVAVLKKLGINQGKLTEEEIIEGGELEKISQEELRKRVGKIVLFARVNPQQKLKIVEALKDKGEVVAMTGDGVNDAPAIKKADIGIVVGEASDVARETADLVLLDSSFSTIVAAVEEGRAIFENIRKVVLYLLSDSFTEVILVVGSLFLGLPLPLTAAQILWVNLIEDGLPGIALAFEPKEEGVMLEPARAAKTPLLDTEMKLLIFIIGIITDLGLLTLLYFLDQGLFHLAHIQTIIFASLAIDSLFYIFSCRSLRQTVFHKNIFENKVLDFSFVWGFLMLFSGIHLPFFQTLLGTKALEAKEWLLVLGVGLINFLLIETTKFWFIKKREKLVDKELH